MSDTADIDDLIQDFEPVGDQNIKNVNNEFLSKIDQSSGLKVLQRGRCIKKLKTQGYSGLVLVFVADQMIDSIWKFTIVWLKQKGYKKSTKKEFRAYIGLEMAMSIVQYMDIKSYWKTGFFVGHDNFKKTMSRGRFQQICGSLSPYHPVTDYKQNKSSKDPLWHSRNLLEHFQRNCMAIAVPIGTAALDEARFRTKARTLAKSYLPSKPDKYAVRFYAAVGNVGPYLSSLQDNQKGNTTKESGPESYCKVFKSMNNVYKRLCCDDGELDPDSASATWVLQMAHLTKMHRDPSGQWIFLLITFTQGIN